MSTELKTMFEPACGEPSPFSLLASNYGRAMAIELPSGVDQHIRSALPQYEGDKLATEYLSLVANNTRAPSVFKVADLLAQLKLQQQNLAFDASWIAATQTTLQQQPIQQQQDVWNAEEQITDAIGKSWLQEYVAQQQHREKASNQIASNGASIQPHANKAILDELHQNNSSQFAVEFLDQFEKMELANSNTVGNDDQTNYDWIDQFMEKLKDHATTVTAAQEEQQFLIDELDFTEDWKAYQQKYRFNQSNPHLGGENLLEKAHLMVSQGRNADAQLYYEAALQQHPENADIWCALGLCLTENEQDCAAIAALQRSIQLAPNNTNALLALSASFINEAQHQAALQALDMWLVAHCGEEEQKHSGGQNSLNIWNGKSQQSFAEVERRFLAVTRQRENTIGIADAELYNAMSVLYNLNEDYIKAIECVQRALTIKPEDPILWNRLGATLANSDRSKEAIAAYQRALELFPTYCRARYNLGVACMNLRNYREAVINFLCALKIQDDIDVGMMAPIASSIKNVSEIWTKVRSSLIRMDNPTPNEEIMDSLNRRDIAKLLNTFQ